MTKRKSNLLKAFEAASSVAHKRTLNVAGEDLIFPRLNIKNQALFEKRVRQGDGESPGVPGFSLSLTRNRSSMAMSGCVENVVKDLRTDGLPEKFANDADAQLWEAQLQAGILKRWEPYAETIFSPFDRSVMAYAVLLSLQQEYGDELASSDGDDSDIVEVNMAFLEQLFGDDQIALDKAFLWVVGLANIPEEQEAQEAVKTASELIDKYAPEGDGSGNAESPSETTSSPSES